MEGNVPYNALSNEPVAPEYEKKEEVPSSAPPPAYTDTAAYNPPGGGYYAQNPPQQYPAQQHGVGGNIQYPAQQHGVGGNIQYPAQPQYQTNTTVVVQQPHTIPVQGMVLDRKPRGRAQTKHAVIVPFAYWTFACCTGSVFFFSFPCALAGFIVALVSLWKQERGNERASNILGWIAIALTITSIVVGVICFIVAIAFDASDVTIYNTERDDDY